MAFIRLPRSPAWEPGRLFENLGPLEIICTDLAAGHFLDDIRGLFVGTLLALHPVINRNASRTYHESELSDGDVCFIEIRGQVHE